MSNYKMPNWSQLLIKEAAGLGDLELTVVFEDATHVLFQCLTTRDQYYVAKRDGKVSYDKNERKVNRNGNQRKRPAGGDEGFL